MKEYKVGDTVYITMVAKITDVAISSIEVEGGTWIDGSDPDTKIEVILREEDLIPVPREELTDDQQTKVDDWYARVTTQPTEGDYSFYRFLDWSGDNRLGGNKLAGILDMPLSCYMQGKWIKIHTFPRY